jgi:hypothetical protein
MVMVERERERWERKRNTRRGSGRTVKTSARIGATRGGIELGKNG